MKAILFAIYLALAGFVHAAETKVHNAVGVVKSVDAKAGTVTLAHEAVKSLNWPAMSMAFKVQDKAVMEKLAPGRKVEFEFEQRGRDYVITGAK